MGEEDGGEFTPLPPPQCTILRELVAAAPRPVIGALVRCLILGSQWGVEELGVGGVKGKAANFAKQGPHYFASFVSSGLRPQQYGEGGGG